MEINKQPVSTNGIKFIAREGEKAAGRAYLYIMKNDLHDQPFGFMEDVFVEEEFRKHGIGSGLVVAVIAEAKVLACYKLICTSRHDRPEVHKYYTKFGFYDRGLEFRMDLK